MATLLDALARFSTDAAEIARRQLTSQEVAAKDRPDGGRPRQVLLTATMQHLSSAGFSHAEIAELASDCGFGRVTQSQVKDRLRKSRVRGDDGDYRSVKILV